MSFCPICHHEYGEPNDAGESDEDYCVNCLNPAKYALDVDPEDDDEGCDADYEAGGLRKKYNITKADGSPTSDEAEYFVLRIDKDPHARIALRAYADSVESDNPEFARDLRYWLEHSLEGFTESALQEMGFATGKRFTREDILKASPTVHERLDPTSWERIFYPAILVGKKEVVLTLSGKPRSVPSYGAALAQATDWLKEQSERVML